MCAVLELLGVRRLHLSLASSLLETSTALSRQLLTEAKAARHGTRLLSLVTLVVLALRMSPWQLRTRLAQSL